VVWVSLTWMYFSEMRKQPLLGKTAQRLQGE
jgi:NNP family nitrate/nitrite transporter-like MFS transporter